MARCKSCGTEIIWIRTPTGRVPLDPRPPVYSVDFKRRGDMRGRKVQGHYVSHFATCPGADEHSKGVDERQFSLC